MQTLLRTPAGLFPVTGSDQQNSVRLNSAGMRVTYARSLKRITLQRYLVSKSVYHPDRVTFPELLALYDNQLWLEDKVRQDPSFSDKFGSFLENLSKVLKQTRITVNTLSSAMTRMKEQLREAAEGHLIPERNLLHTEVYVKGKFHVTPTKESGIPTKELPPVKVIGRGYRDKGTYRDPAWDGSPSWQELATYFERIGDANQS